MITVHTKRIVRNMVQDGRKLTSLGQYLVMEFLIFYFINKDGSHSYPFMYDTLICADLEEMSGNFWSD